MTTMKHLVTATLAIGIGLVVGRASAQAQLPQPMTGLLLDDIIVTYVSSMDPVVPEGRLVDFDRMRDGNFDLDDLDWAIMEFNHGRFDVDQDGVLGQVELDCRWSAFGKALNPERKATYNGIPDGEVDCDQDGLGNALEARMGLDGLNSDSDGDGVPDLDEDSDGDQFTNRQELELGLDPAKADTDDDGLADNEEGAHQTDPLDPDSDDDGLLDGIEVAMGSNPNQADSDGDGVPDAAEDSDGDGLSNLIEQLVGSDPANADSDGDGVADGDEDTDGDGLSDLVEVGLGSDPTSTDTDQDGVSDLIEVSLGTDPTVCEDDPFEPNNDPGSAFRFTGNLSNRNIDNLALCHEDEDWYLFNYRVGDRVDLEVIQEFQHPELLVEVYRRNLTLLKTATTVGNLMSLSFEGMAPGEYLIRVSSQEATRNKYQLTLNVRLPACVDDALEPNDLAGEATILECDGGFDNLIACREDDDYFQLIIPENDTFYDVTAKVIFEQDAGDVNLLLLNRQEWPLVEAGDYEDGGRTLVRERLPPGTYYLQAYSLSLNPSRYAIEVSCQTTAPVCEPDAYEPNATPAEARVLDIPYITQANPNPEPANVRDLRICDRFDLDWYAFNVAAGQRLDVFARFFHFSGDLAMELYCYGDFDTPVAISDDTNDDEQIIYDVPQDGVCHLLMLGMPQYDAGTQYRFIIQPTIAP